MSRITVKVQRGAGGGCQQGNRGDGVLQSTQPRWHTPRKVIVLCLKKRQVGEGFQLHRYLPGQLVIRYIQGNKAFQSPQIGWQGSG